MTQKSQIFSFFSNNSEYQFHVKEIHKALGFPKQSINRVIQELILEGYLVRISKGNFAFNIEAIHKKILKLGASCNKKAKRIFAITFENNDTRREGELLEALEKKYPECDIINLEDYRDLDFGEGDITFGYSDEIWEGKFKRSESWKNIRTGEEKRK